MNLPTKKEWADSGFDVPDELCSKQPTGLPRLRKLTFPPQFIIVRGLDPNRWFVCKRIERDADPCVYYIESTHQFLQAAESELVACEERQP